MPTVRGARWYQLAAPFRDALAAHPNDVTAFERRRLSTNVKIAQGTITSMGQGC